MKPWNKSDLMPALFLGHGNPMNALSRNTYTEGWASIGASIPRPKAVLSVSAHWHIPGCAVTEAAAPRTILGLRRKGEPAGFPVQGVDGGSVSMLAVRIG